MLENFVAANRMRLAGLLYDELSGAESQRYRAPESELFDAWLDRTLGSLVDLLRRYLETGDRAYAVLFTSDLRWAFRESPLAPVEQLERRRRATVNLRRELTKLAEAGLDAALRRAFDDLVTDVVGKIEAEPNRRVSVLLVGDCVNQDIMRFLDEGCASDGLTLEPVLLGATNSAELRNDLRAYAAEHAASFDVAFYSPFAYTASLELRELDEGVVSFVGRRRLASMVADAVKPLRANVELISALFDCSVFVHNGSMIQRFQPTLKSRLKAWANRPVRRRAAALLKPLVDELIADLRRAGSDNVHLIDETALVAKHGEERLGRYYHVSGMHHATVFGNVMADQYRDRVFVQAALARKKLVVCDLDNTIWDGVIGEGPVVPFHDRQRALRKLRERGVLLAVSSKNDPANVHFRDCSLSADDFVCQQINWDLKVTNMSRIQQALNLKTKDFVFIDDRADERDMVAQTFPEVLTLDATDERTWRLLELWGESLPSEPETDRTRQYKERAQREAFIGTLKKDVKDVEEQGQLLRQLGIKVTLRAPGRGELARVSELINRTNQFNVNGARTSLSEVQAWHASPAHRILVAGAADKFGDSGTVCVCVVERRGDEARIPVFVLSCRVFGYAIEHAVMNHVKHRVCADAVRVVGAFSETQFNQPCRRFYPEGGFSRVGEDYVWERGPRAPDADWLNINVDPSVA
jgi:FkbH-like protein